MQLTLVKHIDGIYSSDIFECIKQEKHDILEAISQHSHIADSIDSYYGDIKIDMTNKPQLSIGLAIYGGHAGKLILRLEELKSQIPTSTMSNIESTIAEILVKKYESEPDGYQQCIDILGSYLKHVGEDNINSFILHYFVRYLCKADKVEWFKTAISERIITPFSIRGCIHVSSYNICNYLYEEKDLGPYKPVVSKHNIDFNISGYGNKEKAYETVKMLCSYKKKINRNVLGAVVVSNDIESLKFIIKSKLYDEISYCEKCESSTKILLKTSKFTDYVNKAGGLIKLVFDTYNT